MKGGSHPSEKESPAGSSDPGVGDSVDPLQKRGLFQRVADFLYGCDFCISSCWADGYYYAAELERRLEGKGYNCFLDRSDYAKGEDWRPAGQRALKKTRCLILVGTLKAVLSEPVAAELEYFSSLPGRRVIPIDIGGALSESSSGEGIFQHLNRDILCIDEKKTALTVGPSVYALEQLRNSFVQLPQDQKRVRWLGGLAALFALLAAVAVVLAIFSYYKMTEAERQSVLSLARASEALLSSEYRSLDALTSVVEAGRRFKENRFKIGRAHV